MAKEDRIDALEVRHKHLHACIEAAEAEKAPEQFVKRMKVEKLEIKDEISQLREQVINQFR
jgi:hypothetical protein|tara:strand:- start:1123 stop:1305 length:183 start_codon:yes stop_codon:yes gene_type:complete